MKAAIADNDKDKKFEANKKAVPRKAAGQCWEDPTLADWPESKLSVVFYREFYQRLHFYDLY